MPAALQTVGWWARPNAFVESCRRRYGHRFTLRLLMARGPFVIVSDPEEIKQVFTAPADVLYPGEGARILEPIVGSNSILLLDEGPHMTQRKLVLPAFHGERMAALESVIEEVAREEIERWPRGESVAMHPRLQSLTMEIILRAVFGLRAGQRLEGLRQALTEMLEFGSNPLSMLPAAQRATFGRGPYASFLRVRERANSLIYAEIAERRGAGVDGDDILTTLLGASHEDGSPMSDEEVHDELLTLLVAGHETTATELSWALERLTRAPEALATLVEEVDGSDGDAYMTAVIREVLRRRPVLANAAPRNVKKPIEVGGVRYEPGTHLVASAYLVHHDAAIYPDPYAFRPERFLDTTPGTYTWIPFGGGRRRCIGASFAMLEMSIVLREILRAVQISTGSAGAEGIQRRQITVTPGSGAETVLRPRAAVAAAS